MHCPRFAPVATLSLVAAQLLLTLAAGPAAAQSYRCSSTSGVYYSDRPCPVNGGTKLGSIGPEPEPAPPPIYARQAHPSVARAPDYQNYMSAECASLSD